MIQFNSFHKHAFNDTKIELLEGIASHIGSVMMRVKAEETLSKNEELLRTITENAPDIIMQLDQNGTILYLNRVLQGYTTEESIGKSFQKWTLPEYHELMNRSLKLVFDEGTTQTYLSRGLDKEDQMHWYRTSISPVKEVELVRNAVLITRDITESILSEEILRESEEKKNAIVMTAMDGFWIADRKGCFLEVNDTYCRVIGYTRNQLLTMRIKDIELEDNTSDITSHIKKTEALGEDRFETCHRCNDGTILDVEVSVQFRAVSGGQFVTFIHDITKRKRAEEVLAFQARLLSEVHDSVFSSDSNYTITYWNQASERIFGWTKEEALGKNSEELLKPKIESSSHDQEGSKLRSAGNWEGEAQFTRKDGTCVFVDVNSTVLKDANGKDTGKLVVARDMTERKKAEDELRLSEARYKSIFQNNHSILMLINPDTGEIADANPAACIYYGWSHDELCTKNIDEINTLTKEEVIDEMQNARGENRKHFHFRHKLSSNEIRDVEVYSGPVQYGETILLYSIIHDITERKQAEEALLKNERLLKSVLNNVNSGVALINESGRFTIFNPLFLKLFGLAEESTIKNVNDQNWSEWQVFNEDGSLLNVDDHPVRKVAITGERIDQQLVGVKLPSGGEITWILISAEPLLKANGEIEKIICTYHDITKLKLVENALCESEQRLDAVFNEVTETIMMMDLEGNVLTANNTAASRWGMTIDEIKGFNGFKYIPPEKKRQRELKIREMFETNSPIRFEDDSEDRNYDLTFYPIIETSGEINKFVMFNRDITEQKLAEEAVVKSEKKLIEIYASMSEGLAVHELLFDPSGKAVDYVITEVNPAYEKLTGIKQHDVALNPPKGG